MKTKFTQDGRLPAIESMTVKELQAQYREVFGTPTKSKNKAFLQRRLADWHRDQGQNTEIPANGKAEKPGTPEALENETPSIPPSDGGGDSDELWESVRDDDTRPLPKVLLNSEPTSADSAVAPPATLSQRTPTNDPRLPPVGTVLSRVFGGKSHRVVVCADGFEYNGKKYRSLSAVARAATGSQWNGFRFFCLR